MSDGIIPKTRGEKIADARVTISERNAQCLLINEGDYRCGPYVAIALGDWVPSDALKQIRRAMAAIIDDALKVQDSFSGFATAGQPVPEGTPLMRDNSTVRPLTEGEAIAIRAITITDANGAARCVNLFHGEDERARIRDAKDNTTEAEKTCSNARYRLAAIIDAAIKKAVHAERDRLADANLVEELRNRVRGLEVTLTAVRLALPTTEGDLEKRAKDVMDELATIKDAFAQHCIYLSQIRSLLPARFAAIPFPQLVNEVAGELACARAEGRSKAMTEFANSPMMAASFSPYTPPDTFRRDLAVRYFDEIWSNPKMSAGKTLADMAAQAVKMASAIADAMGGKPTVIPVSVNMESWAKYCGGTAKPKEVEVILNAIHSAIFEMKEQSKENHNCDFTSEIAGLEEAIKLMKGEVK